jgi:hypothetical protein
MPLSTSKKISQKGLASNPTLAGYQLAFRYLWRIHMQSCLRRGVLSGITPEEFFSVTQSRCHYCGAPPENETKVPSYQQQMKYNGIDRVDNSRTYTADNLVPCCKICNSMKSKLSRDSFLAHVGRIYRYQQPNKD